MSRRKDYVKFLKNMRGFEEFFLRTYCKSSFATTKSSKYYLSNILAAPPIIDPSSAEPPFIRAFASILSASLENGKL